MERRKKTLKKVLSICLIMLLTFCLFAPSVYAEEAEGQKDGEYTVYAEFDVQTQDSSQTWPFQYNDEWFNKSAASYSHDLAKLSLGMSMSAFRPTWDPEAAIDPSLHVKDFLFQCGFRDLRADDYDKNPSLYTVSTMIGNKEISDGKETYTLLAVGVCGGGYQNEWMSNFSIGDGETHAGFQSAANEVYDRIFGYVAEHKLQGNKLKIWVSGYSRSGGIANILGAKLVDSDFFDVDTVFVYAFGCPRTTKSSTASNYPNIFSICGKMDPIPNVPFADWGYERNGITLFFPAQQTDSDYAIKRAKVDEVFLEEAGIEQWNNVEWDTKSRVILNYLLKIAPTNIVYKDHVQEHLINIYQSKDAITTMRELLEMANDDELITDSNRSEANSFLTYIAYTVLGYSTGLDLVSKYSNKDANVKANLAHEHMADVYLAWMFSTDNPEELYSDNMEYLRVIITGVVDVAIFGNDKYEGLVKCVLSDGEETDSFFYNGITYDMINNPPEIFMDRNHGQTIIVLPKDAAYDIVIKSNRKQKVEVHAVALEVGRTNGDFNKMHYADLEAGQYDVVYSTAAQDIRGEGYYDIVAGDTFDAVQINDGSSQEFAFDLERANILKLSWKQIVILFYVIPTVVISYLMMRAVWFTGQHRLRRKKKEGLAPRSAKYDKIPSMCIISSYGLFFLQEMVYWLMPDYPLQRTLLKLAIGLLLVLLCIRGYRKQPTELSKGILSALLFCVPADILSAFSSIGSICLYIVAGLILCWQFYKFEKPDKWQYIMTSCMSLAILFVILRYGTFFESVKIPLLILLLILDVSVCLSMNMPKKFRFGTILLFIACSLIFTQNSTQITFLGHFFALAMLYLALGFFAAGSKFKRIPGMEPGINAAVAVN